MLACAESIILIIKSKCVADFSICLRLLIVFEQLKFSRSQAKFGKWQEAFEYVYKNVKILGYIVDSKSIETYNDKKCINIQKNEICIKAKR